VWIQEVGTSSDWIPEAYISEYATTLLENAAACQNVWGFTGWCSHDIDPAMKGFLSLEYTLGVFDQQNRVKTLGKALSKLADEWRKNPPAVISRSVVLVINDKGLSKKGDVADWSIAKQYMDLVSRGVRPAIVLESRAGEQRDRRADRSRIAITRNQHFSTNSIERRKLRHKDPCNNEF
jgi:hypothetical protein